MGACEEEKTAYTEAGRVTSIIVGFRSESMASTSMNTWALSRSVDGPPWRERSDSMASHTSQQGNSQARSPGSQSRAANCPQKLAPRRPTRQRTPRHVDRRIPPLLLFQPLDPDGYVPGSADCGLTSLLGTYSEPSCIYRAGVLHIPRWGIDRRRSDGEEHEAQ
jgi:hypothetical protein